MSDELVLGIDLGTTNSCVAIVEGGTPRVLASAAGFRTMPSVVAVADNGRRLVGRIAKRQAITNAQNTVFGLKRVMGRAWDAPAVQRAAQDMPYTLVEGPHNDVRVQLRDKMLAAPEVAAMVLSELRHVAETALEREVSQAVITIPAYFNDAQRQATLDAGEIAGLDVIRIINEPTAAALAYGFGKDMRKKVAVFDLGGGTFDISILEIGDEVFEVLATSGDTYLGGVDFDQRIVDWLAFGFAKENEHVDLRADKMALQRLLDAAEKAKIELSSAESADIHLPFIISSGRQDALHLQRTLTRAQFEKLVADHIERTVHITERTLREAKLRASDISEVLLVGGQTRTPAVQKAVETLFGIPPCKGLHPDEAVAIGAAVQGAALVRSTGAADLLLLDVTPHNLGIMIAGGYFQTLIEANTTVPTQASHVFTTVRDGQTMVKIVVLQGGSRRAEDNEVLGEFVLTGLRSAPRGEVSVDVSFEISADGIVSVTARDEETGAEQAITVTAQAGLTEEEVRRMVEENAAYAVTAKAEARFAELRTESERMLREIERLLPEVEARIAERDFGRDAIAKAKQVIERTKSAILAQDEPALEDSQRVLDRTLQMFRGVASTPLST